jgi:predicted N-acetyltransferase YhbS
MTLTEFDALPHRLGWKHEYWDGAARLSPEESAIAEFRRPITTPVKSTYSNNWIVRPIQRDDSAALIELFLRAFESADEFAGYSESSFRSRAAESVARFFARDMSTATTHASHETRLSDWKEVSFVVEDAQQLIGAALIREVRLGPILEPIMIAPAYQRRGVGSALLATTLNKLRVMASQDKAPLEYLYSRCHLSNPHSLAWHTIMGFEEMPNLPATQHRWLHHMQQARSLRLQGQIDLARTAQTEANRLATQVEAFELSDDPHAYGALLLR